MSFPLLRPLLIIVSYAATVSRPGTVTIHILVSYTLNCARPGTMHGIRSMTRKANQVSQLITVTPLCIVGNRPGHAREKPSS